MSDLKEGKARVTITTSEEEIGLLAEIITIFCLLPDAQAKRRVLDYVTDYVTKSES